MQVIACTQDVGQHAASLFTHLNLQREQGQFCDCVLRQKQNPDQIYPAHRCVLAASSPVWASILLSAGALVELQDPCLPGSVLGFLLDYIYTGVLPRSLSQQQYYRVFTAACHLQMEELQEALRAAWRRMVTEEQGSASNGAEIHSNKDVNKVELKTFCDLSLSPKSMCFRGLEETETLCSPDEVMFEEAQMNSVSFIIKDKEMQIEEEDSNHPSRTDLKTLNDLNSFCELKSDESKVIQHNLLNNHVPTEVIPGVNKDEHDHRCHSDWPGSTEEELLETSKLKRRSSSSSSTSSHQCFGAVPVICHSSSMAPASHSCSTDSDNTTITEHQHPDGEQNPDTRNNKNHPEPNDNYNSSTIDQFITNSELLIQGLTHSVDHDSLQRDRNLVPQSKAWSKGSKREMENDCDHFASKHQRFDCSERHNESLTAAAGEQTKDRRSVLSLPEQDSEAGNDFHRGDGLAVEAKQEHIFSIRLPAKADTADSNCEPRGSDTNTYPNHFSAGKSRSGVVSIQHGYRSNSTSTSSESGLDDAFASECCASSEFRGTSSSKTSCLSPVTPVENSMSDPTSETVGQPYRGHIHYQYCPHQDTHSLIQGSKYSQHRHSYSLGESTDEEEAGSFAMKQNTNQVLLLDMNSKPAELPCRNRSDTEESWGFKRNKESSVYRDKGFIETNEWSSDETGRSSEKDQHKREAPAAQKAAETITLPVCPTPNVTDSEQSSMPSTLSSCVSSSPPVSMLGESSAPNQQPFQCSLCDRSFSQRGSLNRHVRSHLGVRPFPCPCCPMTFSRQYRVTEHMRVHQRCSLGNAFQKPVDSSSKASEEPQN
ncbi:uncharacterized protein LOC106529574 [Austrofundulus limnaeus]|uniref:Uncharacterized protein LOC106529574 n=1 Tax=Austrofundulus limnaeus TaxID=52670 RepID=A0A2I4CKJ0_AUSLI|nr:PREDICTED: uncharacterized protein LOC106529574 [Austrofundulus limnaeus]